MRRDVRLVFRTVARTPGLALLVVLTLGLAVGANAAIFSLIDRVALRPLPVERPDELVMVNAPPLPLWGHSFTVGGGKVSGMDYPLAEALRAGVPNLFSAMGVYRRGLFTLSIEPAAVEIFGDYVNADYFRVYSLRPIVGRTFTSAEDRQEGAAPVVVLNHALWIQQFGADRSILGRTIRLNNVAVTVIGVLGPGYSGTDPARPLQVFLPLGAIDRITPRRVSGKLFPWNSPALRLCFVVARLRAGIDRERAQQALRARYQVLLDDAIAKGARLTPKDREYYATRKPDLIPAGTVGSIESQATRTLEVPLRLLLGMTAFVLAVAAGNVANLLLARGAARSHEVAVSFALGARRWHLLRPLLLESLLLASASAAVGLLLSAWTGNLVPALLGLESELAGVDTGPDARVVVFALAVSLAMGLFVWLASAFAVTRRGSSASLVASRPVTEGGRSGLGLRRGLVIVQVALSLALLCTSALFARSLLNVLSVDPGFDPRALVAFSVNPGAVGYEGERRQAYVKELVDEIRALPGVSQVAATSMLPLTGGMSGTQVHGPRQAAGHAGAVLVDVVEVGPAFFETLGLPVTEGRRFDERDVSGAPRVAVVNETLARLLVDEGSALGQMVGYENMARDMAVVGVVRDVRTRSLKVAARPTLFLPHAQVPIEGAVHILARTRTRDAVSAAIVSAIVKRLDPAVAVTGLRSVDRMARDRLLRERMLAGFSILFAALSAILAAMGLFGVTSFNVARRAREIAIRLALGASRTRIERMVFREVGLLALVGGSAGLILFLAANRVLQSLLFEISANDPVTIAAAAFALAAIVCLSGVLPARRAARLDPAVTLRSE